jgi:maltose alpha-D-glucosyltransferase / alpha-amylase
MMRGERRHIELAYSLQFTMPGTPVLRYGEEIGMGEDLRLSGREAIRTPMQWDETRTGGFSTAAPDQLIRPVPTRGRFSAAKVNVEQQRQDPGSLLRWFEQLIRVVLECPEISDGMPSLLDIALPRQVLGHRYGDAHRGVILLHNLGPSPVTIDLGGVDVGARPLQVFADSEYETLSAKPGTIRLAAWGYRWIRAGD